jgi:5-(carboxyamino)imidazole ribonucleotide synthase
MLGGGQLGKYALVAANAMGYHTIVVDPDVRAPAGVVANTHLATGYDDPATLERLATECSVVTTEFENTPADALRQLGASTVVAPPASAVAIAQDRIVEKEFLAEHEIPVGPFVAIPRDPGDTARAAAHELAAGALVKTARFGYDGKGQRRVGGENELAEALATFADVDCIVEGWLELDVELSVILARSRTGQVAAWEVTENVHVDGILDLSVAPARVSPELRGRAVELATTVAEHLGYVGVLAVEMFVVDGDRLLVNEIAPRPHNSGHWTIDASVTSQFEQQIRAVCGVGFGDPSMTSPAVAMVNLLGDVWIREAEGEPVEPDWSHVLADPRATLHLYGKAEPRPGRKMGHLTVTGSTSDAAERRARALRSAVTS